MGKPEAIGFEEKRAVMVSPACINPDGQECQIALPDGADISTRQGGCTVDDKGINCPDPQNPGKDFYLPKDPYGDYTANYTPAATSPVREITIYASVFD